VVLQIRAANTRFTNRVAGSAELAAAQQFPLKEEMAFVVQVADSAPPNQGENHIDQLMTERIAIICALRNDNSKRDLLGFTAYSLVPEVRNELFVALLGWQPSDTEGIMYYAGGRIISVDMAWLWYQFEFEATTRLQALYDPGAGALPYLTQIYTQWKIGGENMLPLPKDTELPTNLLNDPVIEELIEFPADFDPAAFDPSFSTLQGVYNKKLRQGG